jgi:ankyrin repeat protein
MYELARLILRASHCSENRNDWEKRNYRWLDQSVLTLYEGDQTPLHIMCSQTVDLGMVQIIYESIFEDSLTKKQNAAIQLPAMLDLLTSKNRLGCTPLHYLAENRSCPISTLEKLLSFTMQSNCPREHEKDSQFTLKEAMLVADDDKETPLHWALSAQVSAKHFQLLIEHGGKDALWCTNNFAEFPFDLFARSCQEDLLVSDDESDSQAQHFKLFEKYLSIVEDRSDINHQETDKEKICSKQWLPLHRMASSLNFPCPWYLFELGLKYYGSDLSLHDDEGMLPIHLALSARRRLRARKILAEDAETSKIFSFSTETLILKILEHHKESATTASSDGRQPLHFAVESQAGSTVIDALLSMFPGALSIVDPWSGLYPFALAAVGDNNSLDVVFHLIRSCPSILAA